MLASLAKWLRLRLKISRPRFDSCFRCASLYRSSHTRDFIINTPVAALPGTWHYRVSAGTGWPGVSVLCLGEMESLICNFYPSVAAHAIVWAPPSLCMLTCCWDAKQPTATTLFIHLMLLLFRYPMIFIERTVFVSVTLAICCGWKQRWGQDWQQDGQGSAVPLGHRTR